MKQESVTRLFVAASAFFAAANTSVAAASETVTGVTNVTPAVIIIAIAVGLILTMILKPTITALTSAIAGALLERRIRSTLVSGGMDLIEKFILPGTCGGLVPIDYAVMAGGGVVCVQVKYYKGTVSGTPDDPQWTCTDGSASYRFMNPLMQNEARADAIRQAVPGLPVGNLVVFTGPATFVDYRPENVLTLDELQAAFETVEFDEEASEAVEDWDAAWLRLKAAALTDEESRKDLDAQVSFG